MPKLLIGCKGQWRAGPMNRAIFQTDGTPMIPIFHHSNRTTLSLDSEALEGRLSTGCERSETKF